MIRITLTLALLFGSAALAGYDDLPFATDSIIEDLTPAHGAGWPGQAP